MFANRDPRPAPSRSPLPPLHGSVSPRIPGVLLLVVTCLLVGWIDPAPASAADPKLVPVRDLLDRGQAAQALDLLKQTVRGKLSPEGLMLRGTGRIMLGELESGARDLEAAIEGDPTLREAWMSLAGLDIVEGKYEKALAGLRKAHELDPSAPDGHLNLGAVLVLMGRRAEAKTHFDRYLELSGDSAEAHFLVAVNYALGRLEHLAVEALGEAIRLDERMRLRARRDDRFLGLDSLEYRVLLNTDEYVPPADHHQVAAAFQVPYENRENRLLYAVLEALREQQLSYEPEVESNARWALIWGDGLRVKVYSQENGTGVVSLSAAPSHFPANEWQRVSQELFRAIHRQLGG